MIVSLGKKIGLENMTATELWEHNEDASPYIVQIGESFHYRVSERGQVISEKVTKDVQELLYWIFSDLTFSMGVAYEFDNRIETQDCRRLIFAKQLELLAQLNPHWREKRSAHFDEVLREHPFSDERSS